MGKASRVKRERNEVRQATQRTLVARAEAQGVAGSPVRIVDLPEGPRVADSLTELAKPYLRSEMDLEQRKKVLVLGVLAWNSALLQEGAWRENAQRVLEGVPADARAHLLAAIEEMRRRKLQLFPGDLRRIVDIELREQNDGSFYLGVAVAVPVTGDAPSDPAPA